jgi:hypothetical protein
LLFLYPRAQETKRNAGVGSCHAAWTARRNRPKVFGDDAIVSVQNPVRLNEYTEPQPDVTVIRPRDHTVSLPVPEDVLLLIEVSLG